jgi:hypothetical protein
MPPCRGTPTLAVPQRRRSDNAAWNRSNDEGTGLAVRGLATGLAENAERRHRRPAQWLDATVALLRPGTSVGPAAALESNRRRRQTSRRTTSRESLPIAVIRCRSDFPKVAAIRPSASHRRYVRCYRAALRTEVPKRRTPLQRRDATNRFAQPLAQVAIGADSITGRSGALGHERHGRRIGWKYRACRVVRHQRLRRGPAGPGVHLALRSHPPPKFFAPARPATPQRRDRRSRPPNAQRAPWVTFGKSAPHRAGGQLTPVGLHRESQRRHGFHRRGWTHRDACRIGLPGLPVPAARTRGKASGYQ